MGSFQSSPGALPDAAAHTLAYVNKYWAPINLPPLSLLLHPQHSLPTQPIQSFFDSTLVHSEIHLVFFTLKKQTNKHPPKNPSKCSSTSSLLPLPLSWPPLLLRTLLLATGMCLDCFYLTSRFLFLILTFTVPPTALFLAPHLLALQNPVPLSTTPSLAVCWEPSSLLVLPW